MLEKQLVEVCREGNSLATLETLRDKLARKIEYAQARDAAPLTKQFLVVLEQIEALKISNKPVVEQKESMLHVVQNNRANRMPRAKNKARAKAS